MYKEGFATRLKKAREDAGYTQSQVEEYTGIKETYYHITKQEEENLI